jgi:hypothetical protein
MRTQYEKLVGIILGEAFSLPGDQGAATAPVKRSMVYILCRQGEVKVISEYRCKNFLIVYIDSRNESFGLGGAEA